MTAVAGGAYAAPESDISFDRDEAPQSIFSIRGRVGVLKYFGQTMLWTLVFLAIVFAVAAFGVSVSGEGFLGGVMGALMIPVVLPYTYVMLCFGIKRLHDLNHSGWFMLLAVIPLVNIIFGLYMMFWPGKAAANRFGERPETKTWEKVLGSIYIALMVVGTVVNLATIGAGVSAM